MGSRDSPVLSSRPDMALVSAYMKFPDCVRI